MDGGKQIGFSASLLGLNESAKALIYNNPDRLCHMIPTEKDIEKIEPVLGQLRSFIINEKWCEDSIINSIIAAYQFAITRHRDEFQNFLASLSKPVPESITQVLTTKNADDIDWYSLMKLEEEHEGQTDAGG